MSTTPEHVDVVVVGAGLSGIGAAYRLQTECPDRSFAVLEARDAIGGTWDLFRYPGVRSDSDMFTLGYPFEPWRAAKAIADGPTILGYIHETAAEFGIDAARSATAPRSSAPTGRASRRAWTVAARDAATATEHDDLRLPLLLRRLLRLRPRPTRPAFPGLEDFAGEVVHPQFWPEDLEYAGKRVVVIGSGATAVTLVPAMAADAAHVTMLQRSPDLDRRRSRGATRSPTRLRERLPAEARPPGHPDQEHRCSARLSTSSASASPSGPARCCSA